jgi:RNA polymerase sigma factor (sigma-70 family)
MLEGTFEQAYPIALRAAQVRATAAVVSGAVPHADREDLEQEGLTACWRALPRYDPARASLRTFVEHVVAARLASIVRTARHAPVFVPISSASMQPAGFPVAELEFHADLRHVLSSCGSTDRQMVLLLQHYSPAEVGRILGIPRSTVHDRIIRLRPRFTATGLRQSRHRNGSAR